MPCARLPIHLRRPHPPRLCLQEGWRAFYRGIVPSMLGILPYAGVDITIFELLKERLLDQVRGRGGAPPGVHAVCAAPAVAVVLLLRAGRGLLSADCLQGRFMHRVCCCPPPACPGACCRGPACPLPAQPLLPLSPILAAV